MSPIASTTPKHRPPRLRLTNNNSQDPHHPITPSSSYELPHFSARNMEQTKQHQFMEVKRRTNPLRALDTPLPKMNTEMPALPVLVEAARLLPATFAFTDGLPFSADTSVSVDGKLNKDEPSCSKTVDYRLPDPTRRPMEVKVAGRSLFVDPTYVQNLSPMLTRFFVREMVAGKHKKVESQLENLNYNDVLEVLKALCPTELGLFPTPVSKDTFATLVRMSSQFKIPKLKQACEQFVAHIPISPESISVDELVDFLSLAVKYHMSITSKIRLFCGLLSMPAPIIISSALSVEPLVKTYFASCYQAFCDGKLAHGQLLDKARLKVPCNLCRTEPPNEPIMPLINQHTFAVCNFCHSTLCAACTIKPCNAQLQRFLTDNFTMKRKS